MKHPERKGVKLVLAFVATIAVIVAQAADLEPVRPAASGCATQITATNAQEQLIGLSKLLDPSGRLASIISDFKVTENEQVKREATPEVVATTTIASSPAQVNASLPTSSAAPEAVSASTAAAAASTAMPASSEMAVAASTTASVPAQMNASMASNPKPSESANVTVNVFLQLVPDAKTEELINNPDKAISSSSTTSAPEAASSSTSTQAPSTSSSPAATGAPADQAASSTSAPSTSTTAAPVSSTSASAPARRRRRRSLMEAQSPATAVAPASSTTTSTTTTTTSTTTTQAPPSTRAAVEQVAAVSMASSSEAPSSTTAAPVSTTNQPAPASSSSAQPASSTAAPPSTTTSTTTTAAPTTPAAAPSSTTTTTTTTTTTAAPAPATSSSTTTVATVEISVKDLASEHMKTVDPKAAPTVEILVSSTNIGAASQQQQQPPMPTSGLAQVDAGSPTGSPQASTSQPKGSTSAPGSGAQASGSMANMLAGRQQSRAEETQVKRSPTNYQSNVGQLASILREDSADLNKQTNKYNTEEKALKEEQSGKKSPSSPTTTITTTTTTTITTITTITSSSSSSSSSTSLSSSPSSNITLASPKPLIDNLNVIYDNDTSIATPSGEQVSQTAKRIKACWGCFPDADEEFERENYATCLFKTSQQYNTNLTGRLDFWQPIENRGALHLLARLRHVPASNRHLSEPRAADNETALGSQRINKRESFIAPIERAPADGQQVTDRVRYQVRLHPDGALLAELSATDVGPMQEHVEVDAELAIGRFNLTKAGGIADRYLSLELPGRTVIGHCKVVMVDKLPQSELDRLPGVSKVQPATWGSGAWGN